VTSKHKRAITDLHKSKKGESEVGSIDGGANCGLHRAPRGCAEDEGGPLGVGLQELISNHLKLLWSKAMVVSV
jgi:hypothetical protein